MSLQKSRRLMKMFWRMSDKSTFQVEQQLSACFFNVNPLTYQYVGTKYKYSFYFGLKSVINIHSR